MAGNAMSVPVVGTILLAAKSFPEAYDTPKAPKKRSSGINQGFGADAVRSLSTFGRLSELGFGLGPRAAAFFCGSSRKPAMRVLCSFGITQKSNDSTTYPFIKEQ